MKLARASKNLRKQVNKNEMDSREESSLENLTNIRQTARTSRKNEKHLHTWSLFLSTVQVYRIQGETSRNLGRVC